METGTSPQVPCRICALDGIDKRVSRKGLNGHLAAHYKAGWSRKKYLERWPDAIADFEDFKPTPQASAESHAKLAPKREAYNASLKAPVGVPADVSDLIADPNLSLLTDEEREFYDQFYALVLQTVDRDEVQMPVIGSLVLDMVVQKRLRRIQLEATSANKKTFTPTKELEDAIEKCEKRIQNSMKALSISREMLAKNREQSKSTAAGLISGYLDEIERNSAEALDALVIDEKKAWVRAEPRLYKLVLQHAKDLEPEEEVTEDGGNAGAVVSFEDALARAGLDL